MIIDNLAVVCLQMKVDQCPLDFTLQTKSINWHNKTIVALLAEGNITCLG